MRTRGRIREHWVDIECLKAQEKYNDKNDEENITREKAL